MVSDGVCPRMAYVLCHCLSTNGDENLWFAGSAAHTAIHARNSSPDLLPNFITGDPLILNKLWSDDPRYFSCKVSWIDMTFCTEPRPGENIIDWLSKIPIKSVESQSLNIFNKNSEGDNLFTYQELLNIIPRIKEEMDKL